MSIFILYVTIGCIAAALATVAIKYYFVKHFKFDPDDLAMVIILMLFVWPITVPIALCYIVAIFAHKWIMQ